MGAEIHFLTADTQELICHAGGIPLKTVYLLQPNGLPHVVEPGYKGFMKFGGVCVISWLAKFNTERGRHLDLNNPVQSWELFVIGASLFKRKKLRGYKYPLKLSFDQHAVYEDVVGETLFPCDIPVSR